MTDTPLTDERLAEIDNSIPHGYEGPWTYGLDDNERDWVVLYPSDTPLAGRVATVPDYGQYLAEFIAGSRTAVPELVAEVRRLRAENAGLNDLRLRAIDKGDRLCAELEQARAQLATVAAAEGAARTAMEAVLLVPDRDPDAAASSSERHTRIGYNDALSDVRDAIGTTTFEPRPTRDQARAEAFNEAIDRFKSLANLAPDAERAPGLNFAIGALMSMRARTARES